MIHQCIKTCGNCFRSTPIYNSFLSIYIMYSISIISIYTPRKANMTMEKNNHLKMHLILQTMIFQAVMLVFILDIYIYCIYIHTYTYTYIYIYIHTRIGRCYECSRRHQNGVAPVEVIADLFNFMEYAKARGRHDGRFTQIRLWIQFVLGKAVCLILGILDVCGKLTFFMFPADFDNHHFGSF